MKQRCFDPTFLRVAAFHRSTERVNRRERPFFAA